jgi:hypothetical protein
VTILTAFNIYNFVISFTLFTLNLHLQIIAMVFKFYFCNIFLNNSSSLLALHFSYSALKLVVKANYKPLCPLNILQS